MSPQWIQLLQIIAYLGLILGVIGTVAPVLPGPVLIWASMLLWAWTDGFRAVGWPTLAMLAVLAILAELSDIILAATGAKKGGASWQSMAVAGVAAIAGMILFSLIGAIIAAFLGLLLWETHRHGGEWRRAWRASGSFIVGYVAAMIFKVVVVVVMLAVFAWQALTV